MFSRQRRSHKWLAGILAAHLGIASGCLGAGRPSIAGVSPDYASLMELPGCKSDAVPRAQKPTALTVAAERPLGPNEVRGPRIRAEVNGACILEEEVVAAAYHQLAAAKTAAEKAEVMHAKLNEIIERELLLQDAEAKFGKGPRSRFLKELEKVGEQEFNRQWLYRLMRANNQSDPDAFRKALRDQGMPVDMIKRQWVRNFMSVEYLRSKVDSPINKIGHPELEEYYKKHNAEFRIPDSVIWQDIFIASAKHPTPEAARALADNIAARARRGEDFGKLAKQYDNGTSSLIAEAYGIGNKRGEIQPREAEAPLFGMKDGDIGPVVAMETGFHIIRLVKRTHAGVKPFDEKMQKEIRDKLRQQVYQAEMREIINKLKSRAIIEVKQLGP